MTFRAFVMSKTDNGIDTGVQELGEEQLDPGEVTIDVGWSGLNYKDAMVAQPGNRVARKSPLIPGVDLAGTVVTSDAADLAPGTPVVVHGYDLGVAHHGGFAEKARVPAGWVVPLPAGLDARQAMAIGTAGFTAFVSVRKLRSTGLAPGDGPVLVTGASGGVGSISVALLASQGFEVVASSGKQGEHDYLRELGATQVVGRDLGLEPDKRVLGPERWAGAVDCVGGATLAAILRTLRYGGAVAASGLTGGTEVATTVYPFIIRDVALLGVDSVLTPIATRREVWDEMASALPGDLADSIVAREISLDELDGALRDQIESKVRGRVLLRL